MRMRRGWTALVAAAVMALSVGAAEAKPGKGKGGGKDREKPAHRQVVVNGVVALGDGAQFVVARRGGKGGGKNGLRVTVFTSEETQFRKSDGSAASAADVVEKARVQVKGKKAEGGVLARRVMIKMPEPEEEGEE